MDSTRAPIGIYDSGVGGLTVWLALKKTINLSLVYYGDTAHVPYGDKTKEQIMYYSHNIINFLQQQQVKVVVAACNTSSALAIPTLQLSTGIPLFEMITPAGEKAIATTKNNKVGLIATVGTVNSGSYQTYFQRSAPNVKLFPQKCPKLVPLIEAGKLSGPVVYTALHQYLDPLLKQNIDTLILGCTHYPFLLKPIQSIVGPDVKIVDPAWQTAQNVRNWFMENNYSVTSESTTDQFWTSGDVDLFKRQVNTFLGQKVAKVQHHQPPEELPSRIDSFLGELSPMWRGDDH